MSDPTSQDNDNQNSMSSDELLERVDFWITNDAWPQLKDFLLKLPEIFEREKDSEDEENLQQLQAAQKKVEQVLEEHSKALIRESANQIAEKHLPIRREMADEVQEIAIKVRNEHPPAGWMDWLESFQSKWNELGEPVSDAEKVEERRFKEAMTLLTVAAEQLKNMTESSRKHFDDLTRKAEHLAHTDDENLAEMWHELFMDWRESQKQTPPEDNHVRRFHEAEKKIRERIRAFRKKQYRAETKRAIHDLIADAESLLGAKDPLVERQRAYKKIKQEWNEVEPKAPPSMNRAREHFLLIEASLRDELDWERWSNGMQKNDLIVRAQKLAEAEPSLEIGEEVKKLQAEWKEIGLAEKDHEKWETFYKVCNDAFEKYILARKDLEVVRGKNLETQTRLCEEVEALVDSTEWKKTADIIKKLQADFKAANPVKPGPGRKVWQRFNQACNKFFERRNAFYDERRNEQEANAAKKEDIIERAKKLCENPDWKKVLPLVKKLQEEWKQIGSVPHKQFEELWSRFREVIDPIYDKEREERSGELGKNREGKESVLGEFEKLVESSKDVDPDETIRQTVKKLRELPQADRKSERELRQRFDSAADQLREKIKQEKIAAKEKREEAFGSRLDLLAKLDSLILGEAEPDKNDVKNLKRQWKKLPKCEHSEQMDERFRRVMDWLTGGKPSDFEDELDYQIYKAENLCLRIEEAAGLPVAESTIEPRREWMLKELSSKMGRTVSRGGKGSAFQAEWVGIGPLKDGARDRLEERFKKAVKALR